MHTPQQAQKEQNKLQLRIDTILTIAFLVVVFTFGVMTVLQDPGQFKRAIFKKDNYAAYLEDPDNATAWDVFSASIRSLDNYISGNGWKHTELGYVNSSLQYALGKQMIATGSSQMLKLNTGHLYDLQSYMSMDNAAENISTMRGMCGDIPFLFVYEHPTIYSDQQMPEEYACLDFSTEVADELIGDLKNGGIEYLDSRDILKNSGLDITEYLMYTDQHWATRASIVITEKIAEKVTEMTGTELDTSRISMDNLDTQTYEKLFLGKYGQRIGTSNVDPDDITIYWPKYETNIHRYTKYVNDIYDLTGPFYDSVIRWQYLEPDEGKTWNCRAYVDYGLTENYDIFENPDGADITILLLKDSYSASMGSFLSLMAGKVVAIDLRRNDCSLTEIVEEYQPDIVVQAYSLQMLRQEKYEFQ